MRHLWLKAIGVLAGIWLVAGGVIWWAARTKPTPESVGTFADPQKLQGRSPAEREELLRKLADQINQLDFEQRREMRMGKRVETFFKELDPQEQSRFIDLTFPSGFRQMMDAFNKMTPDQRRRFVDNALKDMRRRGEEATGLRPDDPHRERIINQGLQAFYSEATAETKMDLAPLLEEMQQNMQGL